MVEVVNCDPAMDYWGCLGEALAGLVERPCANGTLADIVSDATLMLGQ